MNDRPYMSDMGRGSASTGSTLAQFLAGAVVGAGLALLLAPAPGGETRRRLSETARRLGDRASDAVSRAREGESSGGSQRAPQQGTPGKST